MSRRVLALLAAAIVVCIVVVGMPTRSGATFVASSTATATVTAAQDWTPPTVSVQPPPSPLKGTVTVTADAADAETGVRDVTLQHLAPGASAWTTLCAVTTAPYACPWTTTSGPDGTYELRARAVDRAGLATTSATVRTTVANNMLVVLDSPGHQVRGTVPLEVALYSTGTVSYSVRVEYSLAGTGSWRSICTNMSAPYTCSWSTTGVVGDYYDLRAVASSGGTTFTSQVVTDVLVDNTPPRVVMADPGTPLRGTWTFAATAADDQSGVATVELQVAPSGTTTFQTLCTLATEPYSCRYDTNALPNASYDVRAVATDVIGHTTTSAVVRSRAVDNTISAVSLEHPGQYVSGTVTLAAAASSTAGVATVSIEKAPSGTSAWASLCTTTAAPFTCPWATTTDPEDVYDLRAVLVDGNGVTTFSTPVTGVLVDNNPLRGVDVQVENATGRLGRVDSGDVITFTYSREVAPASVSTGWTGAPQAVTLRLRDGALLGLGASGDTLDVQVGTATVHLGSLALAGDYVKTSKTLLAHATMTATTETVGGTARTVVTVVVDSLPSAGGVRTASAAATMVWSPSGAVTDLFGRPASTVPVREQGVLDRDL